MKLAVLRTILYSVPLHYMAFTRFSYKIDHGCFSAASSSPLHFYPHSILLYPSTMRTHSLHLFILVLTHSIPVCGCVCLCLSSLLGMTRRNVRPAGEFSSYPSALKPQRVKKAKRGGERQKDTGRKQQKGKRIRRWEHKMSNSKERE